MGAGILDIMPLVDLISKTLLVLYKELFLKLKWADKHQVIILTSRKKGRQIHRSPMIWYPFWLVYHRDRLLNRLILKHNRNISWIPSLVSITYCSLINMELINHRKKRSNMETS